MLTRPNLRTKFAALCALLVTFAFVYSYSYDGAFSYPQKINATSGKSREGDARAIQTTIRPTKPAAESQRLSEAGMFSLFGYSVLDNATLVPTLRPTKRLSCASEFSGWLQYSQGFVPSRPPPRDMPRKHLKEYTMFGYARVVKQYIDNFKNSKSGAAAREWKKTDIERMMKEVTHTSISYPTEEQVHYAFEHFNISGMSGVVLGTLMPWVEVFALRHGARSVLTVEYQQIVTNHPRLFYAHPYDVAKNYENYTGRFDFVASYSSIEHSGLGRYGDPIDPRGDLREINKIRCMLRPRGLLFLGIPVGIDTVFFNVHRVYGRLRLAMMFAGFELLGTFEGKGDLVDLSTVHLNTPAERVSQILFVLRKTD